MFCEYHYFKNISDTLIRRVKQVHQKIFSERWLTHILNPNDIIFLAKHGEAQKIIAMAVIKEFSPEHHFNNEIDDIVPYLLDFGVIFSMQGRNIGSWFLQSIVKDVLDIFNATSINLDLKYEDHNQDRLIKFYEKNKFIQKGYYKTPNSNNPKEYISMSYSTYL